MRRLFIVTLVTGLLLAAGACGSKEETTSTADQPAAKSSESSTTTEKESDDEKSTTTEGGSDEEDPTDLSIPDPGDLTDIPGVSDECAAITTVYAGIMAQSGALLNPTADRGELDELIDQVEQAKADIPDEISDAFDTWSEAWTEFASTMSEIGDGGMMDPGNLEKMEAASEKLDSPEVAEANSKIEAYIDESCSGVAGLGE